jgi:EAL domain-containing protein (putative c-di-GMP-specific phosphodiesterase class I)
MAGDLLRRSDLAMYGAKQRGRARYTVFDPSMDVAVFERLSREAELRAAIESDQLRLHYQPIIDLESGDIFAFEALARWEHPERGVLAPTEFIPLAEETGLIIPIGRWVLAEACRQLRSWERAAICTPGVKINVNLSARQLSDPGLVNDVARILLSTGLQPEQLQLEITETAAMDESEETAETLRLLRNLGVRLAIDDFGSGFSAFSYLRRCPVDTLKIDRSFVSGLGQNPEDERIVEAVIAFSKTLGLDVVGEGIETADQAARLYQLGCETGQGFLFAHPLAPSLIEAALIYSRSHGAAFSDVSHLDGQPSDRIGPPAETGVRWTA